MDPQNENIMMSLRLMMVLKWIEFFVIALFLFLKGFFKICSFFPIKEDSIMIFY